MQIRHLYSSKVILDILHDMGFCFSYTEVIRFEKNAEDCVEPEVLGGDVEFQEMSVLFAADNVDHKVITIDVKGWVSLSLSPLDNGRTISFREDIYQN